MEYVGGVRFGASTYTVLRSGWLLAWEAGVPVGTDTVLASLGLGMVRTPPVSTLVRDWETCLRRLRHDLVGNQHVPDGQRGAVPWPELFFEVDATIRELRWRLPRLRPVVISRRGPFPEMTPGLRLALWQALAWGRRHGVHHISPTHLALGLLTGPENRARKVLAEHGHDPANDARRLAGSHTLRANDLPEGSADYVADLLWPGHTRPWLLRPLSYLMAGASRLARMGPLLGVVLADTNRQAVRLEHHTTTIVHLLLAMLDLHDQLRHAEVVLPARQVAANAGAVVLRHYGLTFPALTVLARERGDDVPLAGWDHLASYAREARAGDPLPGAAVASAWERASELSLRHRHTDTGTTHLLCAMLADPDGDTATALRALAVDPTVVQASVRQKLYQIPRAWRRRRARWARSQP